MVKEKGQRLMNLRRGNDVVVLQDQHTTACKRRRELIARTWTEDASYIDPLMEGAGQAGIDAMTAGVQAQFPGHAFRRTSEIDAHHDRIRFSWELAPEGRPAVAIGTDFGIVAADGRLQTITGFLDIPA